MLGEIATTPPRVPQGGINQLVAGWAVGTGGITLKTTTGGVPE
jgi:hypothetical protein